MWQNTNFYFFPKSRQFLAELSPSDSEKALRRAKADMRRWLNYTTGSKEVEREFSLYLHSFEQIIKLPLPLLELQPQSTFSQTLNPKHAQQSELVKVLIMRNRINLVFEMIKYSLSHKNCLLQITI